MKTLGKTTWEKIKIGEVFAVDGCWQIHLKISETQTMNICDDYLSYNWNHYNTYYPGKIIRADNPSYSLSKCDLYKLPVSVQRLWREL